MHSAPSVSYPVGRSRSTASALIGIWVISACFACAWRYQMNSNLDESGWRQWLLLLALVLAGVCLWRELQMKVSAELRWDGQHWFVKTDASDTVSLLEGIHLDLQRLMLVRFVPAEASSQWLWLERGGAPERWLALRRALYARDPSPRPSSVSVERAA